MEEEGENLQTEYKQLAINNQPSPFFPCSCSCSGGTLTLQQLIPDYISQDMKKTSSI
jgi:hypothetical protein